MAGWLGPLGVMPWALQKHGIPSRVDFRID